jgi:hypothetical protein
MSIAVIVGVHDGVVLAADSASSLTVSTEPGKIAGIANIYNNANKIFNLYKGKPIGCITFGAGSIGNSSIATLIKDLRAKLSRKRDADELGFDPDKYTMEQVSKIVANFLSDVCGRQPAPALLNLNIGLLLGGYSTEAALGESWTVEIQGGKTAKVERLREPDQAGISWGGATEVLQRIVLGFSPALFQVLAEVSGPPVQTAEQVASQLGQLLVSKLQAPLVFTPMPIQDAIDLAEFLVHAAIVFSRFLPGMQIVGGPIEIAAITKHEGFKWVSRKHYYDYSLNQEPIHVIVDRQPKD